MTMNHQACWTTKEDILHDFDIDDIDEDYMVVGERPPPPLSEICDEEELELRFKDAVCGADTSSDPAKPDLQGITSLLRMVNEDEMEEPHSPTDIVTISKLNPSVKEFVPKSFQSQTPTKENDQVVNGIKNGVESPVRKSNIKDNVHVLQKVAGNVANNISVKNDSKSPIINNTIVNNETEDIKIVNGHEETNRNGIKLPIVDTTPCQERQEKVVLNGDKNMDVSKLKPEQINNITKILRNKISESSRSNTPHLRKERNVAIANLLKLHSSKSNSPTADLQKDKQIVLCTPDYFKDNTAFSSKSSTSRSTPSNEFKDSSASSMSVTLPSYEKFTIDATPRTSSQSPQQLNEKQNEKQEVETKTRTSPCPRQQNGKLNEKLVADTTNINKNPQNDSPAVDPLTEESINKVNKWLDTPPKSSRPKGPPVFLGPISFKSKNRLNGNSPTTSIGGTNNTTKTAPKTEITQYKGSKYAEDLAKQYLERSKTRELAKQDIWTKLENELKAKDEEIRQKALEKVCSETF